MDAITAARQLGKAIQEDERYVKFTLAQQRNDEDTALQEMIASFNEQRNDLAREAQKSDRDQEKIAKMDAALKEMYQQIFQNENMAAFTAAREEMQLMIEFINQIVQGSASGQNPDTIEYQESCGGNCGGCSGCS